MKSSGEQHNSFHLDLPRTAPPEALAALRGVATAFGGQIRAEGDQPHQALPAQRAEQSPYVTTDELRATSVRLWGSEQYAQLAPRFLPVRPSDTYTVESYSDRYGSHVYTGTYDLVGDIRSREPLSPEVIETWVRTRWDAHHVPYELEYRWQDEKAGRLLARPGGLSRTRLAQWVRAHGHEDHQLHGSLGKALDTLIVSAGVVALEDIDPASREVDSEFISPADLLRALKLSSLTKHYKRDIPDKVERGLWRQIADGKAEANEIVVEGEVQFVEDAGGFDTIIVEKIAVSSLRGLIDIYKDPEAVRSFLQGL